MKKLTALFMSLLLVFSLAACSSTPSDNNDSKTNPESQVTEQSSNTPSDNNSTNEPADSAEPTNESGGKTLIVYFSWSSSSNTEKMANAIKEQTGGDVFEIVPQTPYPEDYTECTEVALKERDDNARPAIKDLPESLDEYTTILIGYPIWWHTAPMLIGTFLENYDLTGKEIYPFTQSASMDAEQFENSMEFVKECAKNATVHDGLFVKASDTEGILSYLNENGLNQ